MGHLRAADFRVSIGGTFYAVQEVFVGASVQPIRVSNTEGTPGNPEADTARGFTAVIPDLAEGRVRLVSATFNDDENPYAAPIGLDVGEYFEIEVFPAGEGDSYSYGNCLCVSVSHQGRIPGPQPLTAEFETDGTFSFPG